MLLTRTRLQFTVLLEEFEYQQLKLSREPIIHEMQVQDKNRNKQAQAKQSALCARYPELPELDAAVLFFFVECFWWPWPLKNRASHSIFYLSSIAVKKQTKYEDAVIIKSSQSEKKDGKSKVGRKRRVSRTSHFNCFFLFFREDKKSGMDRVISFCASSIFIPSLQHHQNFRTEDVVGR